MSVCVWWHRGRDWSSGAFKKLADLSVSLPPSPGSSSCCSLAEPGCLAGMGLTTAPLPSRCDKNRALPQLVRLIVKIVDGVKNVCTNTVFPVLSKVLRQGFVSANVWSCEIS